MLHTVVVHLKNSSVLHGYYRSPDAGAADSNLYVPDDLPGSMRIEPEDGSPPVAVDLQNTKAVFFVRSFAGMPSQQDVRFFDSLAIHPHLWVRVTFADGEIMEGRVSNNLELLTKNAFRLFPVDELTNNRCLFVPKGSLREFQIIGLLEANVQEQVEQALEVA